MKTFNLTITISDDTMAGIRAIQFLEPASTPDSAIMQQELGWALETRRIPATVTVDPQLQLNANEVYVLVSAGASEVESVAGWISSEIQSLAYKTQTQPFGGGDRQMIGLVFDLLGSGSPSPDPVDPRLPFDKIGADF